MQLPRSKKWMDQTQCVSMAANAGRSVQANVHPTGHQATIRLDWDPGDPFSEAWAIYNHVGSLTSSE